MNRGTPPSAYFSTSWETRPLLLFPPHSRRACRGRQRDAEGRDRAGARRALLRDQPGTLLGCDGAPLRAAGESFLAGAPRGRVHRAGALAVGEGPAPGARGGITNIVARTTATAAEVTREELIEGRRRLERKVRRYAPRWLAVAGIGAYRSAFGRPQAGWGCSPRRSGRQALGAAESERAQRGAYSAKDLAQHAFGELRAASRRARYERMVIAGIDPRRAERRNPARDDPDRRHHHAPRRRA